MIGLDVDLISEAVVAMEYKASAEDIARICHTIQYFLKRLKKQLRCNRKRALNF